MNRINLFFLTCLVLANMGCSSNPGPPLRDVSFPDIGMPSTTTLGERLLMQDKGEPTYCTSSSPCVTLVAVAE